MKQTEILDLLLKGLYEKGKDRFYSLSLIINEYSIPVETHEELFRLAKRLENDGFITKPIHTRCDVSSRLSSLGIDYCEGDSYTNKGSAIINNTYTINIDNSPSAIIVAQSQEVQLDTKKEDIKQDLIELLEIANHAEDLPKKSEELINKINTIINKL